MAVENQPMVGRDQILRMIRSGELSIDDLPPELRSDPQFIDMLTQLRELRKREVATGLGGTLARTAAGAMMPVVPAAAPALSQIAFGTPITPGPREFDTAAQERATATQAFEAAVPQTAAILEAEAKIAEQTRSVLPDLAEKVLQRQTDKEKNALEASFKRSSLLKDYDLKRLDLMIAAQKAAAKSGGDIATLPEIRQRVIGQLASSTDERGKPIQIDLIQIYNKSAKNKEEARLVTNALAEILSSTETPGVTRQIKKQLQLALPKQFMDLPPDKMEQSLLDTEALTKRALLPAKAGGREAQIQYLMAVREEDILDPDISKEQAAAILADAERVLGDMEDPNIQAEMTQSMIEESIKVGVPQTELAAITNDVAEAFLGKGATGQDLIRFTTGQLIDRETRAGQLEKQEERLMRLEERMATKDQPYRTAMQRQQVMEDPAMRAKLSQAATSLGLGTDTKTLDDVYRAFTTGYKHQEAKKVQASPSVLAALARGESRKSILGRKAAATSATESQQRTAKPKKITPAPPTSENVKETGEEGPED
tara:strand:+ start:2682 stop:4304 length:1623 start_codon:yes stop_codon:yes gene_type:complete